MLLLFLLSLHYLPNPAAAAPAGVSLFPLLFSFFPSVLKSSIGASTLAKLLTGRGQGWPALLGFNKFKITYAFFKPKLLCLTSPFGPERDEEHF